MESGVVDARHVMLVSVAGMAAMFRTCLAVRALVETRIGVGTGTGAGAGAGAGP